MKKTKEEIIKLIDDVKNVNYGTEKECDDMVNDIRTSVSFGGAIINIIFWTNETWSPTEIYEKAESGYKPEIKF